MSATRVSGPRSMVEVAPAGGAPSGTSFETPRFARPSGRGSGGRFRVDAVCAGYLAQAVVGRISSLRRRARKANAP